VISLWSLCDLCVHHRRSSSMEGRDARQPLRVILYLCPLTHPRCEAAPACDPGALSLLQRPLGIQGIYMPDALQQHYYIPYMVMVNTHTPLPGRAHSPGAGTGAQCELHRLGEEPSRCARRCVCVHAHLCVGLCLWYIVILNPSTGCLRPSGCDLSQVPLASGHIYRSSSPPTSM